MNMRTLSAAVALTLVGAATLEAQETYRLDGNRVAVYNLAGEVTVVPGSGSQVVVTVTRGGSDADRLSVEVDPIDGRNALRVMYPDDRVVYERPGGGRFSTNLRVRDDGTFGGGGGGSRVQIRSGGSGLEAWADLRIEVPAGRDVAVWIGAGEADARDLRADLLLDIGAGRVAARSIEGRVDIDTGSGSVEVADITGELNVDTGSGSVDVNGVRGSRITIDTGSGGVDGSDLEADRLVVDTGSGGIRLRGVSSPDTELDTGSGGVEIDFTSAVERLIVDTGSGGVTVTVPTDLNAEVEMDTGSGGIDVDFPLEVSVMRRDHVEGRIGNGRGLIQIDTGSGTIRLRRR